MRLNLSKYAKFSLDSIIIMTNLGVISIFNLPYHIHISYSYQLNLVAPPNKIFGLQEAARERIKQEATKV